MCEGFLYYILTETLSIFSVFINAYANRCILSLFFLIITVNHLVHGLIARHTSSVYKHHLPGSPRPRCSQWDEVTGADWRGLEVK